MGDNGHRPGDDNVRTNDPHTPAPLLGAKGNVSEGGSGEIQRSIPGLVFHFPHYQAGTPQSAIRVGDYKLIKYFESNETVLFDIANDIGERHNLAAKMPGKAAELEALLDEYLQSVDADMPVPNPDYDPAKESWVGSRNYDMSIDPRWVYFSESER
jgi:hypothetical protein